jgi:hypothetical protein
MLSEDNVLDEKSGRELIAPYCEFDEHVRRTQAEGVLGWRDVEVPDGGDW